MTWIVLWWGCSGDGGETDRADTDGELTDTDTGTPPGATAETGIPEELSASASLHETYGTLVRVRWQQPEAGAAHVEFSFDPDVWVSSPERATGVGRHEQLLVGIPYGARVTWRVVVDGAATPDDVIETAPLPYGFPEATATGDPSAWDAGIPYVFISVADGDSLGDLWWAAVIDRQGRAVWARLSPEAEAYLHPRLGYDGRSMLLDLNTYWGAWPNDGGARSRVERSLLDGTVLETWDTPGLHHDFTEMPDGSIVWGAYEPPYVNERLMRHHPDGTVEEVFDCQAWLEPLGLPDEVFCGSNTVTYDEVDGTLWWSQFPTMTILEIDPDDGELLNTWGNAPGSWDVLPTRRDGFWYQHGAYLTPTGTLLTSTWQGPTGVEAVVREYAIDRANETLTLVWEFGEGDGLWEEPIQQMGEVYRLPNGDTLHNTGSVARLREATPAGVVVWDVIWPAHEVSAIGRSAPVADLWALLPAQ